MERGIFGAPFDQHPQIHRNLLGSCFFLIKKLYAPPLVSLIHGHVPDATKLIQQGANINYLLEKDEVLPCQCEKCENVGRPVSGSFIIVNSQLQLSATGNRTTVCVVTLFHVRLF